MFSDAKDVASYFIQAHTGLFDKYIRYELYDNNATQSSVYNILESLRNIPSQDTVVIYFAGHGKTVGDNWYFIPHELTNPRQDKILQKDGISSDTLQLYIARLGANRIFLLLDSCKSGAVADVFSEYKDRRPLALLSRATGIYIAAAAARDQYARELPEHRTRCFYLYAVKGS